MATKKTPLKEKGKTHKMDPHLVSTQPWEIRLIRVKYYKFVGETITHPTTADVKALIKQFNNSRVNIGRELVRQGYESIRAK